MFDLRRIVMLVPVMALAALSVPRAAQAYNPLYCDSGFCQKWDDNTQGTPATITWSFIDAAVGVNAAYSPALDYLTGTNQLPSLRSALDASFGSGAFDAAVGRAFATWEAAANIDFVYVTPDNGAQFAGTTAIDIRIGAYTFNPACCAGGTGYGPPGNDVYFPDPLAGDIALNYANNFTIATGAEGSALPTGPGNLYLNDIEGLLLHEIGHALGLGHSDVLDGVMCGYIYPGNIFDGSACDYTVVNHELDADDIAGIQSIYGAPVPVPLPAAAWLLLSGIGGLGVMLRRRVRA